MKVKVLSKLILSPYFMFVAASDTPAPEYLTGAAQLTTVELTTDCGTAHVLPSQLHIQQATGYIVPGYSISMLWV